MNQHSPAPTTKVTAATLAAAAAVILIYVIESAASVDLPFGVEGAIIVLLTFAAGYVIREV